MRRLVPVLLALSLGLNIGLLVRKPAPKAPPPPAELPAALPAGAPDPARLVDDHVRGITRHLGLDPAQQAQVRAVLERHAPALAEAQRRAAVTQRRLSDVFAAPEFNAGAFLAAGAAAAAARAEVDSLSSMMLVEEASALTPEQRRRFAAVAPRIHRMPEPEGPRGARPPR
ncbi:MAG TPA: periplasmic heavy metal sensor [Candidatus Krumholzibacteria bacterium]|mgnify:CR=1 FL=1|nr:periplasmic heavy metal sensor [Candidatus Krumholzibacteria bacterium]HRX52028.1 periplasmic heavy metal sensor [Candidatus Krumholzibacteria bacterium]